MDFKPEPSSLSKIKTDVLVVGLFLDEGITAGIHKLDKTFPAGFLKQLVQCCADEGFKGKVGQSVQVYSAGQIAAKKLIVWGMGKRADYTPASSRKLAANVARRLGSSPAAKLCLALRAETAYGKHVQALTEGWILGGYKFSKYKTAKNGNTSGKLKLVTIFGSALTTKQFAQAAATGKTIAECTVMSRNLIAEPASYMTPTRLAIEARRIAKAGRLSVTVMDKQQVSKLGMGSFLGVAKGAKEPLKFIVLKYSPTKSTRTIGLIGKGITFDSGGLSLKTAQGMETMKYDMSGAAAVLGVMQAVGKLRPTVAVTGVIAATENMPGSGALHPGDVLTAMNGKTIEVNNTDAEGRLILADALTYACKQKVTELIDIATLTGACVTALGRVAAGVMGSNQKLVNNLTAAANDAGEKLWQLPLFDEFKDGLKSDIADLKNAGSRGEAGASSAAMFLREFVDDRPWAHLDIAGPGWSDKDRDEITKGGTAFGVRTLCYYILGC